MCTMSVVTMPGRARLRIAFNRDESLDRAGALPSVARRLGERLALMPVDPSSGGTWIGVNEAGVALALLNRSVDGLAMPGRRSRGLIIPSLLHANDAAAAAQAAEDLNLPYFAPFRLIALDRMQCYECRSDGVTLERVEHDPSDALMFTSSGLGDSLVEHPRRAVFEALMRCELDAIDAQDRFHAYQDIGSPHLGVWMNRPGAATVSRTVIEITETRAVMTYAALTGPREDRVSHISELELEGVGIS